MTMRISGIASGLDTDSMVQELVKASSKKKDDLVKAQTRLEWKQDAWKDLNTKIYTFFTRQLCTEPASDTDSSNLEYFNISFRIPCKSEIDLVVA